MTIDHNTFNGPVGGGSNPFKIGGAYATPAGIPVTNVDFTNNTVSKGSIPINVHDKTINDILIDHNTFTNTDGLVYVWATGTPTGVLSNFVFTNNKADATNSYGVVFGDHGTFNDANFGAGNTIHSNSLVGIAGAYTYKTVSLVGTYTSYTLPAYCNWWGTTSAATIATKVSTRVAYDPYLTASTDANPTDPGFDPTASCCVTVPKYIFELTPGTSWATNTQTIVSGDCIVYKVTMTSGKEYTFKTGCGDGATATFDTYIEVYNSSGNWITGNDDGCTAYRSTVTWTATETVAYVKVRGYNSLNYGTYTLAYRYVDASSVDCKTPPAYDYPEVPADPPLPITDTWTTTVSRAIDSDECDVYRVAVINNRTYTFKTGCATGTPDEATADFDTYIDVYNASGTWIAGNDDGCSGYTSKVTWTASYSGDAYVKVRGYSSAKFGSYRLAYRYGSTSLVFCQTPPNFDVELTPVENTWLTYPLAANPPAEIGIDGCVIFKVTPVAAQYTFKTGCATGDPDLATADFDTYIELYNATGNFITGNDDGCSNYTSIITWTAPDANPVYVKVRGYSSSKTGTFKMAYKWGAPGAPPPVICKTPTAFDAAITPAAAWATDGQTIVSDACYVYKVTTVAGNIYTFKLGCEDGVGANGDETVGAGFDTFLELYNAAGDWFQSDDDGCESYRSKLVWTATGTIYYVKVRGYNSSNYGPYTAAYKYTLPPHCVTPGVGIAQDEILPDPTEAWQTGGTDAIVSGGCYVYKVAVDEDNIYTFKTGCTDGSAAFDSFLELYDADGDWITENDDGCAVPASGDYSSKIEWTASYTGNAYVKVRGYHSSDYGNFTLAYKHIICGPDVVALATGEPAKNQIKVYPNPANQSFTVVSKAPVTFTRLIVSEFTGRLVKSWDLEQPATFLQIESTGFAPGVYILSIETSEGWIRKKVSIIR